MIPTGRCRCTASIDMKTNRFFVELTGCTGDDDPYTPACPYCLTEDGHKPSNVYSLSELLFEAIKDNRCETCKYWWNAMSDSITTTSHCLNPENNVGNPRGDRSRISYCGPQFYCKHWEGI